MGVPTFKMLIYVHMNDWVYVAVEERTWGFDWASLVTPLPTIRFWLPPLGLSCAPWKTPLIYASSSNL
jgi:hypothetical protein